MSQRTLRVIAAVMSTAWVAIMLFLVVLIFTKDPVGSTR